jgi:uncharacterized protein (UPF0332 family)
MTPFDWRGFLVLADELARRADEEAVGRTAVSRAYYAAFHRVRGAMFRTGYATRRLGSDHALIAEWLATVDESCVLHLRRLRRMRNAADYDADWVENRPEEARQALELARRVIVCVTRPPEGD